MDVFDRVRNLALSSEDAPVPPVDVRESVRATLRGLSTEAPVLVDRPSLAAAGLSLALAAVLFLTFLPSVRLLWDPWIAYMSAPWSF